MKLKIYFQYIIWTYLFRRPNNEIEIKEDKIVQK